MESPVNLLGKQVRSELKKRRLIFITIILLSFMYLIISVIFGNMGLTRHRELNKTKTLLETQVREIDKENKQIRSEIKSLKEDPYYTEKHARENLGLAKPDEYIFQYDR
jgi:cell division protein FtsB